MQKDYCIADHIIRLCGDELVNLVSKIEGFQPFLVSDSDQKPILQVTSDTQLMLAPQMQETLYTFDSEDDAELHSAFGTTANGYLYRMDYPEGTLMQVWCERGGQIAYIKGHFDIPSLSIRALRFLLWIAFGIAVVRQDTVPVHTSTITYCGKNVLFLGESGTGKSTHTRLWREHIAGATLLNDDSPIVRIIDGVPYVYGSPWSGKTPCYKNERYPLAACVRLSQAPFNRIVKLNLIESFAAIHPSCPPDFAYDDYLYDGISDTLDKLLQSVPFYHLQCLPDEAAAKLSCKTIFG